MKFIRIAHLAVALWSAAFVGQAASHALEKPQGKVILVVKGDIEFTNNGDKAEFDLEMLENLGLKSYDVQIPWATGVNQFSGPLLGTVLAAVGAKGDTLRLRALNDFEVEIEREDADLGAIMAVQMNGKTLSVRDKGPLFLVYPFHTNPSLYTNRYFSRSIWQIKELEIAP